MGHTTRCIPLIRYLRSKGHVVTFAGNAWQQNIIKETFRTIDIIYLDGYDIAYAERGRYNMIRLATQLPKMRKAILHEQKWLEKVAAKLKPDGIISDNRYGLYHNSIPSVILTHQLRVQGGIGENIDNIIQSVHYKYLEKFNAVWVIDVAGAVNLSGILAHPETFPPNTRYIGLLSQFDTPGKPVFSDAPLLVLLSGPEPQRSLLADLLWQQVEEYKGKVIFSEGSDNAHERRYVPANIAYHKLLTGNELREAFTGAGVVICRSGYSSVMDLVRLQKKAILIPTPGQTEQQYLGTYLHDRGIFYNTPQQGFRLGKALQESSKFPYHTLPLEQHYSDFIPVADKWMAGL